MKIYKRILLASIALIANSAVAGGLDIDEIDIIVEEAAPYWEIILMGGIASLDAENTTLQLTYIERDELEQTNDGDWRAWTTQLGIGYSIPLFNPDVFSGTTQWFTALEPQVNAYFLQGNIDGNVDRFSNFPGNFNDTDYSIELQSTRLMFDAALTIASRRNLSLYAIAGIGPAWNHIKFHGKETDCVQEINLEGNTEINFAYEFGGGLTYLLSNRLAISLEYLYTGFNDLELNEHGDIGDDIELSEIESENFDLNSQAVFLGLRYAF